MVRRRRHSPSRNSVWSITSAMSGEDSYNELDVELCGQYGHLTSSQKETLSSFKERLHKDGYYRPADPTVDGTTPSHDDVTLLRFLRGKAFDIPKAAAQFAQTEEWRKTKKATESYASIKPEELSDTRRFFPRWTGHRDKHGRPLYVWRLSTVGPLVKELNALSPQDRERRMIALYENLRLFTMRLCSCAKSEGFPTPIGSTTVRSCFIANCRGLMFHLLLQNIIDLEGVSLGLIWSLRSHFQASAGLASTAYPEFLSRVFVVNAPGFFPTAWSYVKGFFDEGTQRKVFILGINPAPEILKFVNAADLPKVYGGELEWSLMDPPKLDDELRALLKRDEFPEGPNVFVSDTATSGAMIPFDVNKASVLEAQNIY
ncbi:CRAL/TRIO domain-containing protein [Auriculariales sp. MPI-PUGE-AT-0066]|nr:CRAL/TRIO domain-containing protein [Auriculariales sp. MPI-PUGE-AT-0066]